MVALAFPSEMGLFRRPVSGVPIMGGSHGILARSPLPVSLIHVGETKSLARYRLDSQAICLPPPRCAKTPDVQHQQGIGMAFAIVCTPVQRRSPLLAGNRPGTGQPARIP